MTLKHILDCENKFFVGLFWIHYDKYKGDKLDLNTIYDIYGYYNGEANIEYCYLIGKLNNDKYFCYRLFMIYCNDSYCIHEIKTYDTLYEFLNNRNVINILQRNNKGIYNTIYTLDDEWIVYG